MKDRIRLYLDEDAQRTDLIQALRARQIDVLTVTEADQLGQPDATYLAFASEHGRVIFTFNRGDFYHLHSEWLRRELKHSGIIVSDQVRTGLLVRRLLRLIESKPAAEMENWLEFLSNWD